jgi:threonine dehydratase
LIARNDARYNSRMTNSPLPITSADIDAAASVIAPYAVRTPLLSSPALDALTGATVFIKPEVLQRTGSFKFRGAFNKLSSIPQAARGGGVVAFSSGNHAQGVAAAAQILGMQATIVMPADSPLSKRERTKGYGAEVVLYDRYTEDREAIAAAIAGPRGATLVKPYDDTFVMAGQGTVGREIAEDMANLGVVPDIVVAPASGGGLIAGIAVAVKARFADTSIIVAEPAGFDDHARSLRAGQRAAHDNDSKTLCDALMALIPGELTFAVNERLLAGAVSATDAEVGAAMALAFRDLKLVVEPGGAVALAALLAGKLDARGKTVVIVLSGGNVDADMYARLVAA